MAGGKRALAVLLLAIGLTACGGGGGSDGARQGNSGGADRVSAEGERLYMNRCMACHGGEREGGFGPELRNVGERLDREALIGVIRDGTGSMPAFRDRLTDEEIEAIVDWIREQ